MQRRQMVDACLGTAIDCDPDHNQLKWGRNKAAFARPKYDEWRFRKVAKGVASTKHFQK